MRPSCYVDGNVAENLTKALVRLGIDAVSTTRVGRSGDGDALQVGVAFDQGRRLIAQTSADFRLIHETIARWARH